MIGVLLTVVAGSTFGQAVSFLTINPDVRTAAMGDGGVALGGRAFAMYVNPSAMVWGDTAKWAAAYSYLPWQKEVTDGTSLHTLAGYYRLSSRHGITAGFRYFTHDDIDVADDRGNRKGSFKPKEFSVDLGYVRRFCDRLSVALGVHYISSDMGDFNGAKKGSAFAVDVSATYYTPRWDVALALTNIGSKIDYGFDSYELPAMLKAGGAYRYAIAEKHKLEGHAELGYRLMPSDYNGIVAAVGVEYLYCNLVAVRGGYHIGDDEKTGPSYGTVGCGVRYMGGEVNFAYYLAGSDSPVKGTYCLSAGWRF